MDISKGYFGGPSVKPYPGSQRKTPGVHPSPGEASQCVSWEHCEGVISPGWLRDHVCPSSHISPLHFAVAPLQKNPFCDGAEEKEGDGEDVSPGNACRSDGEENAACRQIPSDHSPLLIMESLPARNPQMKAERPRLPQLAGRDARHRPGLGSPLKVGGGGGGGARS